MRPEAMHASATLARLGEQVCAAWLQSLGYRVLETNYRCRRGEIDLIVSKGSTIAFVEVKTRTAGSIAFPEEAVTQNKQQRIRLAAAHYLSMRSTALSESGLNQPRFDVIAVTVDPRRRRVHLRLIRDAF
jgi:putative endonuclease